MTPNTATAAWVAWYRVGPRHPWRPVASAPTEAEVYAKAFNEARPGDWLVLPSTAGNPNRRERQ